MNPRTTLALFAVVVLLGGLVYLLEFRVKDQRREAEEAARRLYGPLEAEAVDWVELTTEAGEPARLERREGRWTLAAPVEFPADEQTADGMASTLSRLESAGVIEGAQAPAVYGLGEEARVLRFGGGDAQHELQIGNKTPVGSNTYVKTGAAETIYTVGTYQTQTLERSLDDLREKRPLRFDRSAVRAIHLTWPGGGVRLARADGEWRLVEPLEGPADATTVDRVLSDLGYLRARGFVDEPPPDAEAGLAPPALRAELELGEGEESRTASLEIGSALDGARRLARGAERALYELSVESLDDFPRELGSYRFRTLADFSASDAQSFEIVFHSQMSGAAGPRVVRGRREETGWSTEPDRMARDKAARMIGELSRLRAEEVVADSMGEDERAAVGLAPARVVLRAFAAPAEQGGEPVLLAEVQLGDLDASGILARAAGQEVVYRLDPVLAEHLPVSAEAFENRFLSQEPEEAPAPEAPESAGAPEAEPAR